MYYTVRMDKETRETLKTLETLRQNNREFVLLSSEGRNTQFWQMFNTLFPGTSREKKRKLAGMLRDYKHAD